MIRVDLNQIQHACKVGDQCDYIEPNVKDDCVFYADGVPVGFFMRSMPEKASKLADLANNEFRGNGVPKSKMNRGTQKQADEKGVEWVSQYSTILGGIPPKPHMRRPYPTMSSVHDVKGAQTFIKAMLLLAKESESIIHDILPEQYKWQVELFKKVPDKWKFGNLFTSSISNYNIAAAYHRDAGNIEGAVNVIITKRLNSKGGCLNIPDYSATIDQCDNSILVYPAWRNLHGVTPIIPTFEGGYRNSLVFYLLKAFVGLD